MKPLTLAAVAAAALTVAACGQSGSPGATATPAAATSPAPAPSTPSPQASPMTAAAAVAAATAYFDFYAAGQYAATYTLLSPAARAAVSEHTWVTVHERCKGGSGLAYKVSRPELAGTTAVVNVSLAGAAASVGSEEQSFTYSAGRWLFDPSDMSAYRHHTAAQALAELTTEGICSSS